MAYLTPDEARERGVAWQARPGEPQDLRDPWHYQSPDEARAIGLDWALQPSIRQGRALHAGIAPDTPLDVLRQMQAGTLGSLLGMSQPATATNYTPATGLRRLPRRY